MYELTTLNVYTATGNGLVRYCLGIAAEPVKKPDARLFALDCDSASTLVSQSVSLDHLTPCRPS